MRARPHVVCCNYSKTGFLQTVEEAGFRLFRVSFRIGEIDIDQFLIQILALNVKRLGP